MYVPASDSDVPAIVTLMNRAYRGTGDAASWNSEEGHLAGDRTTETLLRADITSKPHGQFLIWQEEDTDGIAGCVWLEPTGNGEWYLGSLAVDPGRQNDGLGQSLLAAAEDRVRDAGGRSITMTVINVRSPLIAWYLRRGYADTGRTEPYPYGDDRFGMPLRDDLTRCFQRTRFR